MVLRASADSAPLRHWPANCTQSYGTEAIVRTQRVCAFFESSTNDVWWGNRPGQLEKENRKSRQAGIVPLVLVRAH